METGEATVTAAPSATEPSRPLSIREILEPAERALREERLAAKQEFEEIEQPAYDFWSLRVKY